MSWVSLTDAVVRFLDAGERRGWPRFGDLRADAAWLTLRAYGPNAPLELINVAALALSCRPRLVVHRLSPGAVRLVHETDLHTLPGEPPRLLRGGWIVEVRDPSREVLFGQTASLGGYPLGDTIFLVGFDYPDGAWVGRWRPRWEERDLEAGVVREPEESPLIQIDRDEYYDRVREAARFAVVLGLLLDAESVPLAVDAEPFADKRRRKRSAGSGDAGRAADLWVIRRVRLDASRLRQAPPERPESASGTARSGSRRPDLQPQIVPVRGHLRRQPYGPGLSQRKWIWVESYEARRWVAPRTIVDVTTSADSRHTK